MMFDMEVWEIVLLAAACYVAVITLVRLMQRRREGIINDLTRQVETETRRQKEEREKKRLRKRREEFERQRQQRRKAA